MTNLLRQTMLGAAGVLLVGGAVSLFAQSGEDPIAHGQMLYDMHCAKCHGDEGRGDGPLGKKAATRPTDLTRLTETNAGAFPREILRQVIDGRAKVPAHATPDMPVWGETFARQADLGQGNADIEKVVQERIDHLLAFLETLQAKK